MQDMDDSRKMVEEATGSPIDEFGATGGRELQPYSPEGREVDLQSRMSGVTALQQHGAENLAISQQVHHHHHIVHYHIHGDVVDARTTITDSHIGSVGTSSGQASQPALQILNAPGALKPEPGQSPRQLTITHAFRALVGEMELEEETRDLVLQAIDNSNKKKDKNDTNVGLASGSGEEHIPTDEVIKMMEGMKLSDNIENLLIEAFEALIRQDNSEKSTLLLITEYKEENATLSPSFYENHKDLKEPFIEFWEDFQLKLAADTYERHLEDGTETIRALARICAKLSKELLRRKDKSAADPDEQQDVQRESKQKILASRANYFYKLGKDFSSNKKPIHAIFSFYKAAELFKLANDGDNAVQGIYACLREIWSDVKEIAKEESVKNLVIDHVIPIMRKTLDFIRSIHNSSHEVRVEYETWCLLHIGYCYDCCDEYQQFAKMNEDAIELLRTELKEKANNYQIYGFCLNDAGAAYGVMGEIKKAIEYFKMALKALEKASDHKTEERKTKLIAGTKKNLRESERILKNRK